MLGIFCRQCPGMDKMGHRRPVFQLKMKYSAISLSTGLIILPGPHERPGDGGLPAKILALAGLKLLKKVEVSGRIWISLARNGNARSGSLFCGIGQNQLTRDPYILKRLLQDGYGIVLQIVQPSADGSRDSHMITLWGYRYSWQIISKESWLQIRMMQKNLSWRNKLITNWSTTLWISMTESGGFATGGNNGKSWQPMHCWHNLSMRNNPSAQSDDLKRKITFDNKLEEQFMTNQLPESHRFFSRAIESFLFKIIFYLQTLLETQTRDHDDRLLHVFRSGAVISRGLKYIRESEYCMKLLSQVYVLTMKENPEGEGIAAHIYQTHRLSFLISYAHHDISIADDVAVATAFFFKNTDELYGTYNLPDLTSKSDFRSPNYIDYDYLMFLVERWQFLQDTEAYERLKRYCLRSLQRQPFNEISTRHRFIGFYSLLPAPLKEIASDILLQHMYRSNYLISVMKNDPWRFIEQVCLYQATSHDVGIFRLLTAKLVHLVEKHYHNVRYAAVESIMDDTLALTQSLLLYFRCCEEQPHLSKTTPA